MSDPVSVAALASSLLRAIVAPSATVTFLFVGRARKPDISTKEWDKTFGMAPVSTGARDGHVPVTISITSSCFGLGTCCYLDLSLSEFSTSMSLMVSSSSITRAFPSELRIRDLKHFSDFLVSPRRSCENKIPALAFAMVDNRSYRSINSDIAPCFEFLLLRFFGFAFVLTALVGTPQSMGGRLYELQTSVSYLVSNLFVKGSLSLLRFPVAICSSFSLLLSMLSASVVITMREGASALSPVLEFCGY